MKTRFKRCGFTGVILITIGLLNFLPRMLSLNAAWSSDETTWLHRSRSFAIALQHHEYSGTFQSYHPGVTTIWLGGFALWREYGDALEIAPALVTRKFLSPARLSSVRLPVALLTGLLILVIGLLLRRLLGNAVACVSVLFLALDPFLLGESRRLHTDALATLFLMVSLLCWLCYLEAKVCRCREIVFSGICFGLACLSKSLSGGFVLFLPFLLFGYHGIQMASRVFWGVCLWATTAISTVILLWPYLWTLRLGSVPLSPLLIIVVLGIAVVAAQRHSERVSPDDGTSFTDGKRTSRIQAGLGKLVIACGLLGIVAILLSASRLIFARVFWALTTPHEIPQLFLGKVSFAQSWLYYPVHGVINSAPLTAALVVFAIWQLWKRRKQAPLAFRVGLALLVFSCFYLWGLTLVAKKMARYLVITAPAWDVLAAIGAVSLMRLVQNAVKKPVFSYAALVLVLFLHATPVLSLHPNYRAYHHPAIPADWIENNISQGGGTGLDLAAEYLNEKPNAEQLAVQVTQFGGFLQHYFRGRTRTIDTPTTPLESDFVVVYIRDKQIGWIPPTTSLRKLTLEHVVHINGVDYAWIYKVNESITSH
ncbi:MAG: glycosyltransferase family 39 protein [Candidatus Poribacteria bacterium]|nr:glycosyltransferase family 39 protein [Candidatus Poribacteria bacterium]